MPPNPQFYSAYQIINDRGFGKTLGSTQFYEVIIQEKHKIQGLIKAIYIEKVMIVYPSAEERRILAERIYSQTF